MRYTGIFGTVFYFMVSLGTNVAFWFKYEWMIKYYYIVLWIPGFVLVFQLVCFVLFFFVESPRYIFLQLRKELGQKPSDKSSLTSNDSESNNLNSSLLKKQYKINLRSKFFNDPRIRKHAECFYGSDDIEDFLSYSFDELAAALLSSESAEECIEDKRGPFTLGFHSKYRKQFFICILLNFLNQATGINCLVMYSTNIFKQVGFTDQAELFTTLLGRSRSNARLLQLARGGLESIRGQHIRQKNPDQPGPGHPVHLLRDAHDQ